MAHRERGQRPSRGHDQNCQTTSMPSEAGRVATYSGSSVLSRVAVLEKTAAAGRLTAEKVATDRAVAQKPAKCGASAGHPNQAKPMQGRESRPQPGQPGQHHAQLPEAFSTPEPLGLSTEQTNQVGLPRPSFREDQGTQHGPALKSRVLSSGRSAAAEALAAQTQGLAAEAATNPVQEEILHKEGPQARERSPGQARTRASTNNSRLPATNTTSSHRHRPRIPPPNPPLQPDGPQTSHTSIREAEPLRLSTGNPASIVIETFSPSPDDQEPSPNSACKGFHTPTNTRRSRWTPSPRLITPCAASATGSTPSSAHRNARAGELVDAKRIVSKLRTEYIARLKEHRAGAPAFDHSYFQRIQDAKQALKLCEDKVERLERELDREPSQRIT